MLRHRKSLRTTRLLLVLALACFAFAPFVKVGFILMGRQLSPGHGGAVARTVWPAHEEQISTLTPTLRWPASTDQLYEVTVASQESPERALHSAENRSGRLELPVGLLDDETTYVWRAAPLEPDTGESFGGLFSTGTQVRSGPLVVRPSVYNVSPATYRDGIVLNVEAPARDAVEVVLPKVLTAAGTRRVVITGSFRLPIRPALELASLSPGTIEPGRDLGVIEVRRGDDTLTVPVRFDVSDQGSFLRSVVSGFDPLLDTPVFGNFSEGVLATVTRGTCLGMVLSAQESYLDCRDCAGESQCWCPRLRLRSLMHPDRVKAEMNFLHLANFNPMNWSSAVTSTLTMTSQPDVVGEVISRMQKGTPVPLAILEQRGNGDSPGLGHAVLAYALHEFEDHYLLFVFDPDRTQRAGDPLLSFIEIARVEGHLGRVVFNAPAGAEEVAVHALPDAEFLSALKPGLAGAFSAVDRNLIEELSR